MTVFYAYITDITDDSHWRIILTFADSSTADEWWRAVSDRNNALLADIRRINPQIYTHKVSVFNVYNFFIDARISDISKNFRGRLFLTLQNDRVGRGLSIIPNQNVTDLISGNWFYIRSEVDPTAYWYYDHNTQQNYNKIVVSTTSRTLFRVVAKNIPEKTVMIRSDSVTLTAWPQTHVNVNQEGHLIGGSSSVNWYFDFVEFETGRFVDTGSGLLFENVDSGAPKKPGWELVN